MTTSGPRPWTTWIKSKRSTRTEISNSSPTSWRYSQNGQSPTTDKDIIIYSIYKLGYKSIKLINKQKQLCDKQSEFYHCSLETRTCIYTRLYILVEWKCIQSFLNRGKGRHYLASGYKSICFQTNNNTKLQMRSFTGFLYFIKKSILYVCIFSMHANHFALNRMFQNVSRHFSSKINSQLMH